MTKYIFNKEETLNYHRQILAKLSFACFKNSDCSKCDYIALCNLSEEVLYDLRYLF